MTSMVGPYSVFRPVHGLTIFKRTDEPNRERTKLGMILAIFEVRGLSQSYFQRMRTAAAAGSALLRPGSTTAFAVFKAGVAVATKPGSGGQI